MRTFILRRVLLALPLLLGVTTITFILLKLTPGNFVDLVLQNPQNSPAEIQAMADRWSVVEFLQKGLPYREIHRLTGVSVTTIGRVARYLATGAGGYALAVKRLENN